MLSPQWDFPLSTLLEVSSLSSNLLVQTLYTNSSPCNHIHFPGQLPLILVASFLFWRTYYVPLHTLSPSIPYERDILIPLSEMKKLRYSSIKKLAQVHTLVRGRTMNLIPGLTSPDMITHQMVCVLSGRKLLLRRFQCVLTWNEKHIRRKWQVRWDELRVSSLCFINKSLQFLLHYFGVCSEAGWESCSFELGPPQGLTSKILNRGWTALYEGARFSHREFEARR